MPEQITKYKIFLASPSDLFEERVAAEEVIKELNMTHGNKNNYVLELLKWETHSLPGIAENHIQELINTDIGQDFDIFIGMLWAKFGTPTATSGSGTEEEFNLAYKRHTNNSEQIKFLFYFKNAAIPPNNIDPEQLLKVQNFKKSVQDKNILYGQFDSVDIFTKYLRMHIPKKIDELKTSLIKIEEVIDQPTYEPTEELGLLDYRENFVNYLNYSNQSLVNIAKDTEWIGEEISKSANDLTRFNKQPDQNQNVLRSILHRAASSMDDYTNRLKSESTIFYSNFESAIDAGIGFLNVMIDFINTTNLEDLENTKEEIFRMKASIQKGISGMESFHLNITEMPRIEQKFNKSRQKMSNELSDFISKLKEILKLTDEFSKQIGHRIDHMKLTLN